MAGMAAKMVKSYMEAQDLKVNQLKEDLLRVGWDFNGGSIQIYFDFDDTDTHVHLEGLDFIKVPEEKYESMYKVLNEVNDTYKYVKFVLDTEDGQLNAREDVVIQLDTCGEECYELMIRMVQIVQDAFPNFMKALWG